MKYYTRNLILLLFAISPLTGCKDAFLDKKPSADILVPNTLEDLKGLLENNNIINKTPGLPQISADEYFIVNDAAYFSFIENIPRIAYIWAQDLYDGQESVDDWNVPYQQVFYANNILEALDNNVYHDQLEADYVRGWALFVRAYAYYNLVQNFAPFYSPSTAESDMGVPLRLSAAVDEVMPRATVAENYEQIFKDLSEASLLLPEHIQHLNKNRPSKTAVMALLARIYLSINDYERAEIYADSTLALYSILTDFNSISTTSATPFTYNAEEVIYSSAQIIAYAETSGYSPRLGIGVQEDLINLYHEDDLRLKIFLLQNNLGNYNVKRGYLGAGSYPFTGFATDEVYLIKAECLARRGENNNALEILNTLLEKRFITDSFEPFTPDTVDDVLSLVLIERRKELIWRGLRWFDLKRFNASGANITLNRTISGQTYTLEPNSPRYVFPIPDNEIALSGIPQNNR